MFVAPCDAFCTQNNGLTELPAGMHALSKLMTLNISSNRISALPQGFDQLTQLRLFDASKNALSDITAVFNSMTALTVLDLRENQLTSWPQLPEGVVVSLAQLFIGFNSITRIGMSLTCTMRFYLVVYRMQLLTAFQQGSCQCSMMHFTVRIITEVFN
jgi:Leucine rich repeat